METIKFDFFEGRERVVEADPAPAELWTRQRNGIGLTDGTTAAQLLTPCRPDPEKPRYYY